MSCRISCRFNAGCKMYLSVKQCMKNILTRNTHILLCTELNTFKKAPTSMSLVRISHCTSNRTIFKEKWRTNALSKSECYVPLGCNFYSSKNKLKFGVKKNEDKKEVKLSLYQKFKKMYKEYWYVLIPVHLVTSSFWFGGFYYLAASGIDIPALLESIGAPDSWIQNLKNSKAGNVVLAYTLYKVATPARYTVTLGGTTISINYLNKWGWIKPVPNKEQIRKMYEDKKGAFTDLKTCYQDKMQVTKNELLKTKNELLKTKNEMKQQCAEAKKIFHKSVKETRDGLKETQEGFKEGIKGGAEEWKYIGRVYSRHIKDGLQGLTGGKK